MVIFLLIVLAVLILMHGYSGLRLIPTLGLPPPWKAIAWGVLAAMMLLPPLPIIMRARGYENIFTDILAAIGYTSMGFFSLLFMIVVARDLAWLVLTLGAKALAWFQSFQADAVAPIPFDPGRRRFIIQMMNLGLLSATGLATAWGLYEARRRPTVFEMDIPIPNLPADLQGFRIIQISDLHVGPTLKAGWVGQVVELVNSLNPDLVAFTGDLGDGTAEYLRRDVAPLADMRAPHGVYFCTGNHEYYSGLDDWLAEIKRLGMTTLNNEHTVLEHGAGRIMLAGVTDLTAHQVHPDYATDPDAAAANAPDCHVRLLLAHQPGSIHAAARLGFHLMLCGHTHGGQFHPFSLAVRAVHPYIAGLHNHDGTWVYVNRGTGYWGPPMRIGIPPEVTVVRLVAKA
ncbi:MAG: metallophosphoesterase [Candidatus Neomarinimicrobiota bacterium]